MRFWLQTKLKCFLFVCLNVDLQDRNRREGCSCLVWRSRVTWVIVLPHLVAKTGRIKVKMKLTKRLRSIKLCYGLFEKELFNNHSWLLELSGNSTIVPLMPWKHYLYFSFMLTKCNCLMFYILLSLFDIMYLLFMFCYPFCFGLGWYFDTAVVKLTSHWQTLKMDSSVSGKPQEMHLTESCTCICGNAGLWGGRGATEMLLDQESRFAT